MTNYYQKKSEKVPIRINLIRQRRYNLSFRRIFFFVLTSFSAGAKEAWIGLQNHFLFVENNGWAWLDGTPVSISYWYPGEPNESVPCVIMYYNGQWRDRSCSSHTFKYICEKSAVKGTSKLFFFLVC